MKTIETGVLICILIFMCLSCRMFETLSGNESAGTVDRLWTDVPAFKGATKVDMAIPLGARLIIRTAMDGRINFIVFTTNRSAQAVKDFYSKERMKAAGWTTGEEGCVTDAEKKDIQGAVCFFNRKDGSREEGLAIVIAQDEKTGETNIFYARIDLTQNTPAEKTGGTKA